MFAPCSLGCPGTPRHHTVSAARCGYGQPHRTAGSGIVVITGQQFKDKNRTEQRTLNPRVRGSSPWRRTRSDLGLYLFRVARDGRFGVMFAPRLLVSPDLVARAVLGGPRDPVRSVTEREVWVGLVASRDKRLAAQRTPVPPSWAREQGRPVYEEYDDGRPMGQHRDPASD